MLKNKLLLALLLFVFSQSLLSADARLYYWLGDNNNIALTANSGQVPSNMDFPRDSSFPLLHTPKKAQYIPRQLSKIDSDIKLLLLPIMTASYALDKFGTEHKDAINIILFRDSAHGNGFIEKYRIIKSYFDSNNIAYNEPAKTIIEGGNIFFVNGEKAIIGLDTLGINYLTMDDLWPEDSELQEKSGLYYSARNLLLAAKKLASDGPKNIRQNSYKDISEELSDEDKLNFKPSAQKMASRIDWIEKQIAKEIFLSQENIIFIPQRNFHIDLDMTITPENKILLRAPSNDDERVIYKLQLDILNKYFPGRVIEAPEEFTDCYIFNGIIYPNSKEYIFCGQNNNNDNKFIDFLTSTCGYTAGKALTKGFWHDIKNLSAGIHCETQQYFENSSAVCALCNIQEKLLRCSRCQKVYYCGTAHQKEHWPTHKGFCKPVRK